MGKKVLFLLSLILLFSLFLFVPKVDNSDKKDVNNKSKNQEVSVLKDENNSVKEEIHKDNINKEIERSIEKRKQYGFPTDEKTMKNLVDNGDYSDVWNFYMTKEEEKEVWEKGDKNSEFAPKIKEEMQQNNDLKNVYSDLYIDWKKGGVIVVVLKENTLNANKEKLNTLKEKYKEVEIEYKEMKYNEWQLSQMVISIHDNKEKIEEKGVNISQLSSNLINQKVDVGVQKGSLSKKEIEDIIVDVVKIDRELLDIEFAEHVVIEPF